MILGFVFLFLLRTAVESLKSRGVPVPKAAELDDLLTKFLDKKDYTGAVFDFIKGNEPTDKDGDNLDISILDVYNVRRLIKKVVGEYEQHETRRQSEANDRHGHDRERIKHICMDMMKQSIYATKFRMEDTKRFRKFYTNDVSFNFAIFYGAVMQISLKMQTLYSKMMKLPSKSHFLWFLVLYEKLLAANVDVHDMVERMFYLHGIYLKRLNGIMVPIAPTIPLPTAPRTKRIRYRKSSTRRRTFRTQPGATLPPGLVITEYKQEIPTPPPELTLPTEINSRNKTFDPNGTTYNPKHETPPPLSTEETSTPTANLTESGGITIAAEVTSKKLVVRTGETAKPGATTKLPGQTKGKPKEDKTVKPDMKKTTKPKLG